MLRLFSAKVGNEMEERGERERQNDSKHAQAPDKSVVSKQQQQLQRRYFWDGFPLLRDSKTSSVNLVNHKHNTL